MNLSQEEMKIYELFQLNVKDNEKYFNGNVLARLMEKIRNKDNSWKSNVKSLIDQYQKDVENVMVYCEAYINKKCRKIN